MAYEEKDGAKKPAEGEKKQDDKEILEEARRYLKSCVDEESSERSKMLDDLRFAALDQWPEAIRHERENDTDNGPRPCLTIDKLNQYLVQVVNDVRQGRPGINVRPQDDVADPETAKVLKGLIRNIEDQSNADIAYSAAVENAAKIGLGYFRITTEYVADDSFDQEIFIRPIPNTFSVYLGKHIMPDGSDAEHGFIIEKMPVAEFKAAYPDRKFAAADFQDLPGDESSYWHTEDTVTVAEYYCIYRERQTLLFLEDGQTITKDEYARLEGDKPEVTDERVTYRKQLRWRKITGIEVLEKRDLPGKYVPIIEVIGREAWVEGKRFLWGLVRPAKDSLRMYNYWASTITEKMALAPKTPWLVATGQLENKEEKWKQANRKNFPFLEYNAVDVNGQLVAPPQRVGPTPMEAALLQNMEVIKMDVRESLGMYKAAVGETESQQSGRAILALQRESDTGTYHFGANLGISIRHAGRVIVDLIPHYYDTKRIVRILGEDGEVQTAQIDPQMGVARQEIQTRGGIVNIYNPSVGKYDVSITVGPSYNTKRMEAAATFVEMAKGADPVIASVLNYLTVRNSDFNGAEEASKMLKALLPPPVLAAVSQQQQQIPPQVIAQIEQMKQAMGAMQAELQQEKAGTAQAALKVQADHDAEMKKLQLERVVEAEKAKLAREKAEADFALKKWIAEQQAALDRAVAESQAAVKGAELNMKLQAQEREAEQKRQDQIKTEQAPLMENVLPKVMETLQSFTTAFDQAMQRHSDGQGQFNSLLVQEMRKPGRIMLGEIQRGADGSIVGATATRQ